MLDVTTSVRAFKMMDGSVVISDSSLILGRSVYQFNTPALLTFKRIKDGPIGFALEAWIPNELLADTCITIHRDKILGVMQPSDSLVDFYINWATIERDKMALYAVELVNQMTEMKALYTKKYTVDKNEFNTPISTSVTTAIFDMFDEDNSWGDPSVSH